MHAVDLNFRDGPRNEKPARGPECGVWGWGQKCMMKTFMSLTLRIFWGFVHSPPPAQQTDIWNFLGDSEPSFGARFGTKVQKMCSFLVLHLFWPSRLSRPLLQKSCATTNVQHRCVQFLLSSFLLFCSHWAKALCFEGESPGGKILKKCEKFWHDFALLLPPRLSSSEYRPPKTLQNWGFQTLHPLN